MKKYFNLYSSLTLGIIIVIVISFIIIFFVGRREKNFEIEIVTTNVGKNEEITEEYAKEVAVEQFKILGEEIEEKDLLINKVQLEDEDYYFISSRNNTLLIKILGGEITMINSVSL